jgi:hypothetical protein
MPSFTKDQKIKLTRDVTAHGVRGKDVTLKRGDPGTVKSASDKAVWVRVRGYKVRVDPSDIEPA